MTSTVNCQNRQKLISEDLTFTSFISRKTGTVPISCSSVELSPQFREIVSSRSGIKNKTSDNFCVSLSDQWAMNMASIYYDDLVHALFKAGQAIEPIDIRLGVSESLCVNNLNALLKEISMVLLPVLAQPGVDIATIFYPNERETCISSLKECQLQLEHEAMAAYPAGDHVALLEVAIGWVIAALEAIEPYDPAPALAEDMESDSSEDSQATVV